MSGENVSLSENIPNLCSIGDDCYLLQQWSFQEFEGQLQKEQFQKATPTYKIGTDWIVNFIEGKHWCMVVFSTHGLATPRFSPPDCPPFLFVHYSVCPPLLCLTCMQSPPYGLSTENHDRTPTTGWNQTRAHRIKKQAPYPLRHLCVWVGSLPGGDNQNGRGTGIGWPNTGSR